MYRLNLKKSLVVMPQSQGYSGNPSGLSGRQGRSEDGDTGVLLYVEEPDERERSIPPKLRGYLI